LITFPINFYRGIVAATGTYTAPLVGAFQAKKIKPAMPVIAGLKIKCLYKKTTR
jgi:hypothetical protein